MAYERLLLGKPHHYLLFLLVSIGQPQQKPWHSMNHEILIGSQGVAYYIIPIYQAIVVHPFIYSIHNQGQFLVTALPHHLFSSILNGGRPRSQSTPFLAISQITFTNSEKRDSPQYSPGKAALFSGGGWHWRMWALSIPMMRNVWKNFLPKKNLNNTKKTIIQEKRSLSKYSNIWRWNNPIPNKTKNTTPLLEKNTICLRLGKKQWKMLCWPGIPLVRSSKVTTLYKTKKANQPHRRMNVETWRLLFLLLLLPTWTCGRYNRTPRTEAISILHICTWYRSDTCFTTWLYRQW